MEKKTEAIQYRTLTTITEVAQFLHSEQDSKQMFVGSAVKNGSNARLISVPETTRSIMIECICDSKSSQLYMLIHARTKSGKACRYLIPTHATKAAHGIRFSDAIRPISMEVSCSKSSIRALQAFAVGPRKTVAS